MNLMSCKKENFKGDIEAIILLEGIEGEEIINRIKVEGVMNIIMEGETLKGEGDKVEEDIIEGEEDMIQIKIE